MLSRVANSIYWLNRYVERAENCARIIDVNLNLALDLSPEEKEQWQPVVKTTGDDAIYREKFGEYTKEDVIHFLVFDETNLNSILSCLSAARENARVVREIISSEMWRQINELYLIVKEGIKKEQWDIENLSEFFQTIKTGSHCFSGVMDATFSHSEGWHFGILGRNLERADKTARIMDMKYFFLLPSEKYVGTSLDLLQWSALLRSASAFEMYRKLYGRLEVGNIIDFLVLNKAFPRAIHYCLYEAQNSLHAITGADWHGFSTPAGKELGRLRAELDYTDVKDIIDFGLHEYLDIFEAKLNKVGLAIFETFFEIKD